MRFVGIINWRIIESMMVWAVVHLSLPIISLLSRYWTHTNVTSRILVIIFYVTRAHCIIRSSNREGEYKIPISIRVGEERKHYLLFKYRSCSGSSISVYASGRHFDKIPATKLRKNHPFYRRMCVQTLSMFIFFT